MQKAAILFILFTSHFGYSQTDFTIASFRVFTVDQGLSQASVNCIVRDHQGFYWVGTDEGLNRFDGYRFKTYLAGKGNSLCNNIVMGLGLDPGGNLLISTANGFTTFDCKNERFKKYIYGGVGSGLYYNSVYDTARQRIYLASDGGLRFIQEGDSIIRDFIIKGIPVTGITQVATYKDVLSIGTFDKGTFLVDLTSLKIIERITDIPAVRALEFYNDKLFIGTEGDGVLVTNLQGRKLEQITTTSSSIQSNNVWSLEFNSADSSLWIGTDHGGVTIRDRDGRFRTFKNLPFDPKSLSGNTIRSIMVEASGEAWLGTFNHGLNYYSPVTSSFRNTRNDPLNANSISTNNILCFEEGTDGTFFVGTDGGGLNIIKKEKVTRYNTSNGLPSNAILSLKLDSKNRLWIGSFQGGLTVMHNNSFKTYRHVPGKSNSLSDNTIWAIEEDEAGFIWLGTDKGLNRFDPVKGEFTSHLLRKDQGSLYTDNQIRSLLIGRDKSLWVGTFNYLISLHPVTGDITFYRHNPADSLSISPNIIVSILEDESGKIWAGTYGGGINILDRKTGKIAHLDESDGLINNVVLSIQEDQKNTFWISTNRGLVNYRPSTREFINYDAESGIQGRIFNVHASYERRNGNLVFGGTNGYTTFDPLTIKEIPTYLKVSLTDFKIQNFVVPVDGNILSRTISETDTIKVPYTTNFFTFGVTTFNIGLLNRTRYWYRIPEISSLWVDAGTQPEVYVTKLQPGNYHLEIKAGITFKDAGDIKTLTILVPPPWWKTMAAKLAAIAFSLVLVIGGINWRFRQIKIRKFQLERQIEVKNLEIITKNTDLQLRNEELEELNKEITTQKEVIARQNQSLNEIRLVLENNNKSLEKTVELRTERLNQTIEQLNSTIKDLDEFVYSASHDLVAPLKSLLGLIAITKAEKNADLASGYLNHMERSVIKLEQVIKSLVQHSHNSRMELTNENVNLRTLVEDILQDLRYMSGFETVEMDIEIPNGQMVLSDPLRIKIILSNLISNSIKYLDPNKDRHVIRIRYFQEDIRIWNLEVFDNGIGIQPDYLNRIFEMFYRATDRSGGSGLGLFIVKESIARLGGDIKVESEYGAFTMFTLSFESLPISVEPDYI